MNNSSLNQFAEAVTSLDMSRSRFKRPFRHITTFDSGKLIPIYWDEVLPGDTISMDVGSLVRMTTPLFPVMDNAFLDIHAYFVPNRLLWTHWEEFLGANKTTYWAQPATFTPPYAKLTNSSGYSKIDSLCDYLGLPTDNNQLPSVFNVSHLPFRAYCLIWNEWYRDENIMQPCNVTLGDSLGTIILGRQNSETYETYISSGHYVTNAEKGDQPLPVCKFHDYFTSALPAPQKGAAVGIGLTGVLPVKNMGELLGSWDKVLYSDHFSPLVLYEKQPGQDQWANINLNHKLLSLSSDNSKAPGGTGAGLATANGVFAYSNDSSAYDGSYASFGTAQGVDLGQAASVTINALREAFAVQRFLEKAARGGTRYTEILQSFFGVTSSDASLQRPQYLGGKRVPINMTQVAQTAQGSLPVGNLAAFSQTLDGDHLFTKSFEEHGILMVMACVRTERSYEQGVARKWTRTELTDYYFPTFANLGEQPIYKYELYCATGSDAVFGYKEAWGEYRFSPNMISGKMRGSTGSGYNSWHYADEYTSMPSLSPEWIVEPQAVMSRTLAVANEPHFLAEFAFDATWVRPMPVYSIPGLIDHH